MVNFDDALLSPIHAVLAVGDAVLTTPAGADYTIPVIDKTSGVDVGGEVGVPTVVPVAAVRRVALSDQGLAPEDLVNGSASFNGFTWKIDNFSHDPNPSGESYGEIFYHLSEPHELTSSS